MKLNSLSLFVFQSALFAGVGAQLLSLLSDPPLHSAADNALRLFAYSGICLNLGATLTCTVILIIIGQMAVNRLPGFEQESRGYVQPRHNDLFKNRSEQRLLREHGWRGPYSILVAHVYFSFMLGSVCIFLQILIYIWMHEELVVAVPVSVASIFAMTALVWAAWIAALEFSRTAK